MSPTPALADISWSTGDSWILVAVAFLLVCSAVLALAETSLTRTSRTRAKVLEDSGARGAKSLRRLVEQPERFLAPVLLLVLLCQLVAATLVGVVAAHLFGPLGVAVATLFEVVVIFTFGEAVPKQWAVRNADRAALMTAPFVAAFIRFPPVRVLSGGLIGIARFITPGGRRPHSGSEMTESELLAFTDVAVEEAAIESDERELIHSILEFGDTIVREVMVPRPDIVAFEAATLAEAALEGAIAAGFSRLPVYDANMDNVVGIAFTKDLVLAVRRGQAGRPVGEIARAPHFVPETKRVAPLLREMQRERFHLAVVVDEYGGTAGIVSLEDLIEELVGEPTIEALEAGRYRVPAILGVDEVNDFLGAELPLGDDWDTIGGLVLARAGRIPLEGESIEVDGYRLVAGNVEGQRIGWVTVEALDERPPLHLEEVGPADSSSRPIGDGPGDSGGNPGGSTGDGGGDGGGVGSAGHGSEAGIGSTAGGRESDPGSSSAGNPGADAGSSSGVRS
jgi:CBS domain containing-hemolysin-like protein